MLIGGKNKWQIFTGVASKETLDQESLDQERCIRQHALNVGRNAKFLSNLQKESQSTARNVTVKEESSDSFIISQQGFEQ